MTPLSVLQQLLDNWGLLAMVGVFIFTIVFALRPGTKAMHDDIANIPLRNDLTLGEDPIHAPGASPRDSRDTSDEAAS